MSGVDLPFLQRKEDSNNAKAIRICIRIWEVVQYINHTCTDMADLSWFKVFQARPYSVNFRSSLQFTTLYFGIHFMKSDSVRYTSEFLAEFLINLHPLPHQLSVVIVFKPRTYSIFKQSIIPLPRKYQLQTLLTTPATSNQTGQTKSKHERTWGLPFMQLCLHTFTTQIPKKIQVIW